MLPPSMSINRVVVPAEVDFLPKQHSSSLIESGYIDDLLNELSDIKPEQVMKEAFGEGCLVGHNFSSHQSYSLLMMQHDPTSMAEVEPDSDMAYQNLEQLIEVED